MNKTNQNLKTSFLSAPIKQSKITLFIAIAVAIVGFYFYTLLPKQENPDIAVPVAMITTIYPGASLTDIEQLITNPIENAVNEISGFDKVESYSFNSASIVVVSLTNDAEVEKSWQELRRVINDIDSSIPKEAYKPYIDTKLIETAGMIISFSGENYNYEQLSAYAEVFQKQLSKVDGVTRFELIGKIPQEIEIKVDIAQLQKYPISIENVADIIKAQNVTFPAGAIKTENGQINVNITSPFGIVKDIENTILYTSTENGSSVRLKDLATVKIVESKDVKYKTKQNGKNAVLLAGFFKSGKNIIPIGKDVRQRIESTKQDFPDDLIIDEISFEPESIDKSISDFMMNLLQGIAFVMIVVFIALGSRNAIIVSVAIPLSILISFIAMWVFDLKVHQISTTALIIALGLLVDNAIVVVEAVQEHLNKGKDKLQAAYLGAKETAKPILSATLTTIAAFSPLLFLPGAAGDLLGAIPKIVIISLIASYFVSMLVIPALTVLFARKSKEKKIRKNYLRMFFINFLDKALTYKKATLTISFVVLIVAFISVRFLNEEYFPPADKQTLYIDISGESFSLENTENVVEKIEHIIQQQPETKSYTSSIGKPLPRFYQLMEVNVQSLEYAQIKVDFDMDKSEKFTNKKELAAYLQNQFNEKIIGASVQTRLLSLSGSGGGAVLLDISSDNIDRNIEVAKMIRDTLRNLEGAYKIGTSISNAKYEYVADIDFNLAASLGLSQYDIQKQINLALMGSELTKYRKNGNEFPVNISGDISSISELENLGIVSSQTQQKILLKQIADIKIEKKYPVIRHTNKERNISVFCDAKEGYSATEIADIIEFEILPKLNTSGTDITFNGEREASKKDSGNIGFAALAAIFLVYIILMIEFNSFAQPFVILLTLPLAFIGSIAGLLVTGQPFSFTAILGIASLIGIVVNDAILLITFINRAKEQGMSIIEASRDSSNQRFVPIMVTTATTVMALIPLSLSGNEMFVPLAVALMFGLIVATILTLVVIPVLFTTLIKK
ncbi:efflux membrane protein, AcrB/AcrD/AcrF family [Psychroflexus torquis ATCC 700755]|uniref:Efflux membrane protein, AcrB/AcrD/AcrF family n=1 Tax=Psychroflexus torquis (strain ATCC 700755 / CIP 106069 / ACAM 623) TaxID=313595 RepID=K4ID72_PSYTT|nr:efflux RND transporter permease subunit [Psychroflexus torquis]AFU68369.1 efflux membrane protein, AcrB/AcrD/AcrF family [Psychroflexus torquis ATCC 700755]